MGLSLWMGSMQLDRHRRHAHYGYRGDAVRIGRKFAEMVANNYAIEGTIRYPEDGTDETPGKFLYIKSTLTGDESPDILNYHRVHSSFPFDTTLDQFFTESQFESYRRLGEHILSVDKIAAWIHTNLVPRMDRVENSTKR